MWFTSVVLICIFLPSASAIFLSIQSPLFCSFSSFCVVFLGGLVQVSVHVFDVCIASFTFPFPHVFLLGSPTMVPKMCTGVVISAAAVGAEDI